MIPHNVATKLAGEPNRPVAVLGVGPNRTQPGSRCRSELSGHRAGHWPIPPALSVSAPEQSGKIAPAAAVDARGEMGILASNSVYFRKVGGHQCDGARLHRQPGLELRYIDLMATSPIPLQELLRNCHALRRLGTRLEQQRALLEQVRRQLPEYLAPHCQAAVFDAGRLTLYAASPAWASRLRYLGGELKRGLRSDIKGLSEVRIRVVGADILPPPGPKPDPARPLSAQNREMLRTTAEGLRDPGLSAALRRLARHG